MRHNIQNNVEKGSYVEKDNEKKRWGLKNSKRKKISRKR